MDKVKILWADDEIDLLRPHILFLENKGYDVTTAKSGNEALDAVYDSHFDVVFLDENMPGVSGLDALVSIKKIRKGLPIVMITKSEEEHIMEEAIGGEISDYLIKPVNPNQILLSLKKILDNSRLVSEKSTSDYQKEFREIGMRLNDHLEADDWVDIQKKLVYWDLKLTQSPDSGMDEILNMQKTEANASFCKFVERNYLDWLNIPDEDTPVLSNNLLEKKVIPYLEKGKPNYILLLDCLRYDQWRVLQPEFSKIFQIEEDDCYLSILPTATQFARNSIFAGMMPSEIVKKFPSKWVGENDEGFKNDFEEDFLKETLKRNKLGDLKVSYNKITNLKAGKKLLENFHALQQNDVNVIVYNFVDTLSHARTDIKVLRELAEDEKGYRSITRSWFENSPLLEMLKKLKGSGSKLFLTTDHGSVHVDHAVKVLGEKEISSNLRFKSGKNMQYKSKEVFEIIDPAEGFLPKQNVSTRYIFAKKNDFFAYPNNFNHYVKYYKNTFQHGGISMEEMIIPIIKMTAK